MLESSDIHSRRNHLDVKTILLENDVQDHLAVNMRAMHLQQLLFMRVLMHFRPAESGCCHQQGKSDQNKS